MSRFAQIIGSLLGNALAFDAGDWITMNGTHVKVDDKGKPVAGPKNILEGSTQPGSGALKPEAAYEAAKNLGKKAEAGTLTIHDTPVIVSAPSLGNTPLYTLTKGPKARDLEKAIAGDIENHISGETLSLSRKNASHLISSAVTRGEGGLAHMAAVQQVRVLMAGAIPTELTKDKKNQEDVKAMQRFYSAMQYEGVAYRVVMTVKEYDGTRDIQIDGVKKLYDLKLDKKIPGGFAAQPGQKAKTAQPAPGISGLTIGTLLEGVKEEPLLKRTPKKNAAQDSISITLDASTLRRIDDNGFLHVSQSHISKETVSPYYGREIPGWQALRLDPDRMYQGYRSGAALAAGASTFNGLPLLLHHYIDSAANPQKDHRVGSLGTDAAFNAPYLDNSLVITDAAAIQAIESGECRELSAAYRYDPVFKPGKFNGVAYDFIMTNIRGNHIALVEEGRAGSDVLVADETPKRGKKMPNPLKIIEDLIASLKASGVAPHEGGEGEAKAFMDEGTESVTPTEDEPADAADAPKAGETVAEDDERESALAELFALADSVQDEELAAKLKAVGEAIRSSGGAEGEAKTAEDEDAPAEGEEKQAEKQEEKPAMDKKPKSRAARMQVRGNTYNINVPVAMDEKSIALKVEAGINAKVRAAREVRPLLGEVDPLAFDSAASIYRKALDAAGRSTTVRDPGALRELVALACDARPREYVYPAVSAAMANDAKSADSAALAHFNGLARIRRA